MYRTELMYLDTEINIRINPSVQLLNMYAYYLIFIILDHKVVQQV